MKRRFYKKDFLELFIVISGWTICLKLSPNLRKKEKVKIRKGFELSTNYEPEFDKLAQELARTVTGDSINDILIAQITDNED
jgi:hypothetical protein